MGSFLNFLQQHVLFAIFLIGMSITGVTLLIWRLLLNINSRTDLDAFMPQFQEILQKKGVDEALKFCMAQPDSEVIPRRLFTAGLKAAKDGPAAMRKAMANSLEYEIVPSLNFLLPWILGIGKVATMIGLLGTVISMIGTFDLLGKAAESGAAAEKGVQGKASSEIGLALWATALGLITAIPLVFAHVQFKSWIHHFELRMRNLAQRLIGLVQLARPGGTSASASKSTAVPFDPGANVGATAMRRGLEDELKHG